MKKKLLFIAPDYYGFDDVVYEGLKNYSGYDVVKINSTFSYHYKNVYEKITNFFFKLFLKKNLKAIRKEELIAKKIASDNYDLLIINRPDVLSTKNFNLAKKLSKRSCAIFWDSIQKIPSQEDYLTKFDTILSFDNDDCINYNLKKITNFYFKKDSSKHSKFDIAYLATYDNRIDETLLIFENFANHNISSYCNIYTYKSNQVKEKLPSSIKLVHNILPFSESYKFYTDCKIILDIAHHHQKGLSFRPFEAIGLNKKLITTNKEIINYDFYNPQNIFIIENVSNFSIPNNFLESDYVELDEIIKEKYYIKNWIKTIISNNEN